MLKNTLIIALVIALIYLYYQKQNKPSFLGGNSSDTQDTIRDLQTQLQQAHQLETYNGQQLTNYENKVKRLEGQLEVYQKGDDWESKNGEIITDLETENKRLDEILTRTANEKNALEEQLNSILNKWNWGSWKPNSAEEFLNKFEPWINKHLESEDKLKAAEQNLVDSQREIERLKTERETTEEVENLESERDEAIRDKRTAEQEVLSLGNKLKLKSQEADNKVKEIERLKTEKSQSEISLNRTITELREQHRKREKLLDEEQTENNKLTTENEKLTTEIAELKRAKSPSMPGNWDYEAELEGKVKGLEERNLGLVNDKKVLVQQVQTLEKELENEKKKKR